MARIAFLVALLGLVVPSAASARLSVQVDEDGVPELPGKTLLVNGDGASDTVRVLQEDSATTRRISVLGQGTVGNGCVQVISSPARMRCTTDGIVQILILTSPNAPDSSTAETNTVDTTGVTQVAPDGTPVLDAIGGGPGRDVITAGAGRTLTGGFGGDDRIDGRAGNDDINDGAGNDILLGGEGDDTFGGEPTDDSDIVSGGPGLDSVASRGVVTLNDLLCNDGSSRDAPVEPLGVARSVQAPEGLLQCSGSGADRDLFAGIEAVAQLFREDPVDFTGSGADETFQGRGGADRFEGGGGRDSIAGFGGDDVLLARDEGADALLDCGEGGADRAVVDAVDPVEPNCETIERGRAGLEGPVGGGEPAPAFPGFPPPPPPSPSQGNRPSSGNEGTGPGGGDGRTPPELEIPTRVAFVKGGRIQIRVRCVYRAANCVGRLTIDAAQTRRAGRQRVSRGARLASGRVNVPWGKSRATTMRAPRSLVRLLRALRGQRTLKVRATVVARDSGGGSRARPATARRVVTLGLQR